MKKLFITILVLLAFLYSKASGPTDYFRSIASGEWNDPSIWESSADNINWFPTGAAPNSSANTITIRNTHAIIVSNNQDMDQVVIENGGILSHLDATLTVNNGTGDDINVQNGGAFTLAAANNPPVFSGSATVNVSTGGILRISATGLTNAGTGVHVSNFIYQDASILEYTLATAFATAGVTFFPNVNATTIPIFRTTENVGIVGANSNTVINGLFEANGSIIFQNTGTKTFRNGIIGTGNINASSSGKFIINGTTAKFGGTGTLIIAAGTPMDIGPGCTVTMTSDKQMTGSINLLPSNSLIILGNYNLDLTGNVTGGSANSHIVTNGTGKLILNFISGATPRIFPVGASNTTINPIAIFNGGGLNYGARVENGINPPIGAPLKAVNRTWFVTPTGGTPGTVNTNFFYAAGDGNAGFNYTANLELGHYTAAWNVIQTGLAPAGSYQVATTVSTFGNGIEAPLVLGNLGSILSSAPAVSVGYFTGLKQNGSHALKWLLHCNGVSTLHIEIERSSDGRNFNVIHSEQATALRCADPFSFTDHHPAAGTNYYRTRISTDAGKIYYSGVVSLINAAAGIDVSNITPNPVVNGSFDLKISAARSCESVITITDMQGRLISRQRRTLEAGFNTLKVDVKTVAGGSYHAVVDSDGFKKVQRFVVR